MPNVVWSFAVAMAYTSLVVGAEAKSDTVTHSVTTVVHHLEPE